MALALVLAVAMTVYSFLGYLYRYRALLSQNPQ